MSKHNFQKSVLLSKEEARSSKNWLIFDAKGKTLGRFASEIVKVLRGKHKTNYTPHVDCGDGVIVLNAKGIRVTGSKETRKNYYYYTGHIGGLREVPYAVMKDRNPEYIIRHAVKKMMPRSKLTNAQLKRLRVFADDKHDHASQKPVEVNA